MSAECPTGKVCHWARGDAEKSIGEMERKGKLKGRVHVYLCPKCGYYHVGHYDPRVVQKHSRWKRILLERAQRRAQQANNPM